MSVFVFSLDSDSENVGEVSKNKRNGNPGTHLVPQAIKHNMNYLHKNVHARVVESFDPQIASEVISEHQILKIFKGGGGGGMPPDSPSCCIVVVMCLGPRISSVFHCLWYIKGLYKDLLL